ncbi:hypothetical protein J2S40_000146 [Nocardioides luteus]|uniref:Uncharacterized protein n=1 Tax=Nocardioides luteus TaxID=1844 RepID=A0ABQ5SU63_9ACTN|nr:hypothetical protein [Nocardioides luteus]MDR7309088.1 hypothetical protein [Nocardioides luteus]GGR49830.1 hypothetical protein GCM10010197_14830 [Nocardioides luteus]GLJ67494.1 hypothetical protein GCM10017579_15300 [Nocardioides luteus]
MDSTSRQPTPEHHRRPASESARNLWNHGPNWISAIAALIGALGLGGVLTHLAGADDSSGGSASSPTATATVTVTATVAPSGGAAPSEAANTSADGVRWSGEVTLGELNFDFSPPKLTPGNTVGQLQSDMVWVDDSSSEVLIAAWLSDSVPTKEECDTSVAESGSTTVRDMTPGLYVCGKTAEGRIFRLKTLTTGNAIKADATVWN